MDTFPASALSVLPASVEDAFVFAPLFPHPANIVATIAPTSIKLIVFFFMFFSSFIHSYLLGCFYYTVTFHITLSFFHLFHCHFFTFYFICNITFVHFAHVFFTFSIKTPKQKTPASALAETSVSSSISILLSLL